MKVLLNKFLKNNYTYYTTVSVLLLLLVLTFVPFFNIRGEYNELIKLNKETLEEKERISGELAVVNNEELKLDIARAQYKISNDGEILFIFPEDEE